MAARSAPARQQTPSKRANRLTLVLGMVSSATVVVLFGAEVARVWRLGSLPLTRGDKDAGRELVRSAPGAVRVVRDGYRVSSTRENVIFNVIASFMVCLAITRWITWTIRTRGHLGPIRNLTTSGGRHIHHFIPGMVISLAAGGVSIVRPDESRSRWLGVPYGVGVALILDETALLLELEDVYWSEEGVVSLRVAFATLALLAALAYAAQVARRGEPSLEADWETAAKAFDDLSLLSSE